MKIVNYNLQFGDMKRRPLVDIHRIIIHHTAGSGNENAKTIHVLHKKNGWAGIGYHYVIRKDGVIEKGRDNVFVGAHAAGANSDSLGIVLCGNFEIEKPTEAQIESLHLLTREIRKAYKIHKILGHCDVDSTACPGENLYRHIRTL